MTMSTTDAFAIDNDHIQMRVDLNGEAGIGILDTGSAFALIISEGTAKALSLPVGAHAGVGGVGGGGGSGYYTTVDVTVEGRCVRLTDAVVLPGYKDFVLVGLPLLQQLSDTVTLDFAQKQLILGGATPTTIVLTIDSATAQVNGTPVTLDYAPHIDAQTGHTLVPLRFIAEALGCNVEWREATRGVVITK
jgi:hypothetical protein